MAARTTFIMNGANHSTAGLSTYPVAFFGGDWAGRYEGELNGETRGNTTVGNDVWIGYNATIMPGVTIGHGAIIGSCSVVTRNVEPYAIVAGNPATKIRSRFDDGVVAE
jgi:virginiamycin A acetyltransferase